MLGVTGSIAAYKAAILVRNLVREGAGVRVVMTPLAKQFITPLTMATLSRNPILVDFFDPENGAWNSHVSLGEWADCYLIAPATANTIAKMASGIADNLLLTTYLSARCPVAVAPAMDLDMYAHPATQENLGALSARGVHVISPGEGELASGLSGKGRMAEPEEITAVLDMLLSRTDTLSGRRLVVTAGPTVEPIDPVRFVSNRSTGKMGYAIAGELAARGADVILVSGPTSLPAPAGVRKVDTETADEMYAAFMEAFSGSDGAVMCAAVADYTPAEPSGSKLKKNGEGLSMAMKPTRDIAAEAGRIKGSRLLAGFALETDDEEAHAREKLRRKNFDFIVLNSLRDPGAGFAADTNRITVIPAGGEAERFPLESKREAACRIADRVEAFFRP